MREIRDADCIMVIGANVGEAHPVVSFEIVRATKRGATLIVIDPREISLVRHSAMHLRPRPGTDHALYLAMLHTIVTSGWHDRAFIAARTEGFEALAESLAAWTPEVATAICGVPVDQIVEAARLYALGLRRAGANGAAPPARGNSMILYGMGITERSNGTELVKTLANFAMIAGHVGRPSAGINPLRGQNNVQGACDMGSLPNVLPGYQKVDDASVRAKFTRAWVRTRSKAGKALTLPATPGTTYMEMMREAIAGRIKALYIMGANPVMTCPDEGLIERALRAVDFLVVQEIFPTETAQMAHVVLPAAAFAEKAGTFTNLERRFQLLRPVLPPPGEARADWEICCDLGRRIGKRLGRPLRWEYASPAAIMDEIARLCPSFGGISHARLDAGGLQWPCPTPDHPGTPIMHQETFTRGRGRFHVTSPMPPFEPTDETYPLALATGRILYHYNGGPMSRRAAPLEWRESRAYVEINPADASAAGVRDGQACMVRSRRGSVRAQARVGEVVPRGMVYMPFHFREAAANVLTHADGLDADARTPEYKYCAVRLERVGAPHEQRSGGGN